MKILVFGETGQLGISLRTCAGDIKVTSLGRQVADFEHPEICAAHVANTDADAVIVAAAWTGVDAAETNQEKAKIVNADTPGAIARAAVKRKIPVVYVSTDYVFDGRGDQPFTPDHPTQPLNVYGRTKLEGERQVRAAGGTHAILRTSWVFSAYRRNFVTTMLRLGVERERISVVADQIGGPTPAEDLARACLTIAGKLVADPKKSGTYHFSGAPDVSWADFAREIFAKAEVDCIVEDLATQDCPTAALRPLYSRLDNTLTEKVFSLQRPDWRTALDGIVKQTGSKQP